MKINDHRDITYTSDGEYEVTKNSQKKKTITAILVIGDTRHLKFTLHSHRGTTMETIPEVNKVFTLKHGTLFLLHPEDERPFMREWCTQYGKTFFKHSSDGIGNNGERNMSLGIAMRVTCYSHEVLRESGRLVLKDKFYPFGCLREREKDQRSEIILQEYLASEQKQIDDAGILEKWMNCCSEYF
jgi:hypothetical protein